MQRKDTVDKPAEELQIEYTSKPVTGWGGLVVMMRYFERIGLRELLRKALPDGRISPNRIPVVDIVLVFLTTVLTGGTRFAHVERLRADEVVQSILGVARMPSAMTVTRYFGGFVRSQVEHLSKVLWTFTVNRLKCSALGAVLDLDSTVFQRHGEQEGSLKGYNPKRRGRPSHHPLLAVLAEPKIILHAWLRSGNTGSARGVIGFLKEALAKLPKSFRIYALRADSGFYVRSFLQHMEQQQLPYAIVARVTKHLQRELAGLRNWEELAPGLVVTEFNYQAPGWERTRRMVVIREEIRERKNARGRKLIDVPGYKFRVIVTTLTLPPAELWYFYNARADIENRIKELKEDFGASGFCLQSFDGTEAAFRLICFLFNLVAEFKVDVLQNPSPRLMSLRPDILVVGAIRGSSGRKSVLRLGLRGHKRERMATLLRRVAAIPAATVAQIRNILGSLGNSLPRPWRLRRRKSARSEEGR